MIKEELQCNNEIYDQVINNINEVLFIISPDWKTVYFVSPSYEEVWGKTCESLLEHPFSWTDSLHPDDQKKVFQYIEEKSRGDLGDIRFPDYRVVKPDGSIRWIQARGVPILNENGEIYRIAGIAVDISERKEMEEERDNLIKSLQEALNEIKTLKGIIPICSYCKSIRDNEGAWDKIEAYLAKHSDAAFSHGICPKCLAKARSEAGLSNK